MRKTLSMAALLLVVLLDAAAAESDTLHKGLNTSDLKKFCIFDDKLFSIGAHMCVYKRIYLKCTEPKSPNGSASWVADESTHCDTKYGSPGPG
jgi:hypothetical protein